MKTDLTALEENISEHQNCQQCVKSVFGDLNN